MHDEATRSLCVLVDQAAKFINVNHLTLYFPESFNGESLEIFYIGVLIE